MTSVHAAVALTREISPRIIECELTHLARTPINVGRARAEHAAYERVLRALGCDVRPLPAMPELADGVFVEDTAVVLEELAVICRPGGASRQCETATVSAALAPYRRLASIVAPGTLDGGDVLRAGRRLFVGRSERTNDSGIRQLLDLVSPHGYEVVAVEFAGCLHLKSGATLVDDEHVLLNPAWVDSRALAPLRPIEIDASEPFAANALRIDGAVVHAAEFPRTRRRLEAEGLVVHPVPAGELAKAEGGVTCCSLIFAP